MIIQEVLERTTAFFKEKKFHSPRLEAELLLASALDLRRLDLYLRFDRPLSEVELDQCRSLVKRRSVGEPVAYILGRKDFYNLEFIVDARVLIPRPETELLVEIAIGWSANFPAASLVDLGCGSGCIALSVLNNAATTTAVLVDVSPSALEVARLNVEKLKLSDRVRIHCLDMNCLDINCLDGRKFDIVVANPPYISLRDQAVDSDVRQFEPHEALFAGESGFEAIAAWAGKAFELVNPGGFVGFEIGYDQGERSQRRFLDLGFQNVQIQKDLAGKDRFVLARKPA